MVFREITFTKFLLFDEYPPLIAYRDESFCLDFYESCECGSMGLVWDQHFKVQINVFMF